VTLTGQDGEKMTVSTSESKLVEGFPLPVYPGAEVVRSSSTEVNGKTPVTPDLERVESNNSGRRSAIFSGVTDEVEVGLSLDWKEEGKGQVSILWKAK